MPAARCVPLIGVLPSNPYRRVKLCHSDLEKNSHRTPE